MIWIYVYTGCYKKKTNIWFYGLFSKYVNMFFPVHFEGKQKLCTIWLELNFTLFLFINNSVNIPQIFYLITYVNK